MTEMKNGNVLVIEDNRLNMELIRAVLQVKGNYKVLEAQNAEEGIDIAYEYHPDVILMDIQLPGIDGLSATRFIKSDPELRDIPVVAMTSSAMLLDEEKSLAAGCVGQISRPIDVKNFVDTMEELLG